MTVSSKNVINVTEFGNMELTDEELEMEKLEMSV